MMKKIFWKLYAFWIILTEAVGGLSGWLTRDGVKDYNTYAAKPPLTPPPIVFPIVWSVLYALMGVGAARVYAAPASNARSRALAVFFLQLAFNFVWSILFFNLRQYGLAFFWLVVLWGLIFWMIRTFDKVDPLAGKLQIPYLLWVAFAAWLNLGVWKLN